MKLEELIQVLLDEVDPEIQGYMLSDSDTWQSPNGYYKMWESLPDPTQTILRWQELRDRKKNAKL